MFENKKCSRCNRKIDRSFDFCPHCGSYIRGRDNKEDYGVLGKSDDINELDNVFKNSFAGAGFGNGIFNKIFSGAFKMLEKEMQKLAQEEANVQRGASKIPAQGISQNNKAHIDLFINGKKIPLPENIAGIQIERLPAGAIKQAPQQKHPQHRTIKSQKISEDTLEKSKKLPRKEAKAKLTRTSNKVTYELDTPGIKNINDILVNQLEESIEIKAYTDKAVYQKTLPVKLPLMKYSINPEEGKIILEFKAG